MVKWNALGSEIWIGLVLRVRVKVGSRARDTAKRSFRHAVVISVTVTVRVRVRVSVRVRVRVRAREQSRPDKRHMPIYT